MNEFIEKHYRENRLKLLKRLSFKAGGHHQAEDIIQESYYRAMKYYDSCDKERFNVWFATIVNNTYRDYMREESGLSYIEDDDEPLGTVDCNMTDKQTLREIYEVIATKDIAPEEILTLHIRHGYSATDISKITPYSYVQVHKTIQRFKEEMRKMYE